MYQCISNTFVVSNSMPAIDIRRDNEKILSAHLDSYLLFEFYGKNKRQFF
jgi:hypothetical protein